MPNPVPIKYMICKHMFLITFLNEAEHIFSTQLNGFKYFYQIQIILFTINHLFAHKWFQVLQCNSNNLTLVICLHTFKLIYIYDF